MPQFGVNGDFYIDTASNKLYGPKTGGAWGSGVSLVGPQGVAGPASGITLSYTQGSTVEIHWGTSSGSATCNCPANTVLYNSKPVTWVSAPGPNLTGSYTHAEGYLFVQWGHSPHRRRMHRNAWWRFVRGSFVRELSLLLHVSHLELKSLLPYKGFTA